MRPTLKIWGATLFTRNQSTKQLLAGNRKRRFVGWQLICTSGLLWSLCGLSIQAQAQSADASRNTIPSSGAIETAINPAAQAAPVNDAQIKDTIRDLPGNLTSPVLQLFDARTPTEINADEIQGQNTLGLRFFGEVQLKKEAIEVRSIEAFLDQTTGEMSLLGDVFIRQNDLTLQAESLLFNIDTGTGQAKEVRYRLGSNRSQSVYGKSSLLSFDNQSTVTLANARFTTCQNTDDPDWYLRANTLDLDQINDVGEAFGALVYFKDVPLFGWPYLNFPLQGERKSGLLPPTIEFSSNGGLSWRAPYYWNIAPNRDATFTPALIATRGLKLESEFRYLGSHNAGELSYDFINDTSRDSQLRYFTQWLHRFDNQQGLKLDAEWTETSDNQYLVDFARNINSSSQRLLPRQLNLVSQLDANWQAQLRLSSYQFLQDPNNVVTRPYDRLPQLNLRSQHSLGHGITLQSESEYTRFWQPDPAFVKDYDPQTGQVSQPQFADRSVVKLSLGQSWRSLSYFVEPKLYYHYTVYEVGKGVDFSRHSLVSLTADPNTERRTRGVGTFSLDSGLNFEREVNWGDIDAVQTLEPRMFYVYTPYKVQEDLPNFDSALTEFGFSQIFTTNPYSGNDRIADANQVTFALTSRLLNPTSGAERSRFIIAQRQYLSDRRLENIQQGNSDILLSGTGWVTPYIRVAADAQYNVENNRVFKQTTSISWNPAVKKTFNLSNRRFASEPTAPINFDQWDISSQWPLTGLNSGLYGVGKVSYSSLSKSVTEQLLGLEYNSDCWVLRFVTQRFNTTSTTSTTNYFLQLEFSGWTRVGASPLNLLRSNIENYQ